jgi:hypothetical protein
MLTENNFMPLITIPTRITASSKTLIDNILHNRFNPDIKSGNLTVSISDHTPQFAVFPIANKNFPPKNHNIFIQDYKKIYHSQLKNSFQSIDWNFTETNNPSINHETSLTYNQEA